METKELIAAVRLCGSSPKIDQCKECSYYAGGDMSKCIPNMTGDAAASLSALQAENEQLRAGLEREKMMCQHTAEVAWAHEAELEKVRRERDAAVSDLETIMAYGGGNLDTCQFCKNGQCYARGGTRLCYPEWRGVKEDGKANER